MADDTRNRICWRGDRIGTTKIAVLVLLAFVLTNIWMTMIPGVINDDVEIIYFRVGSAAPVDLPIILRHGNLKARLALPVTGQRHSGDFEFMRPIDTRNNAVGHDRAADHTSPTTAMVSSPASGPNKGIAIRVR
tara:strand:+ start:67344 stop:67745 length:402 start_codon:yes stop_codon:yes gene_type:complete